MCNISQGTNDIATYFTRVETLWDQTNDLMMFLFALVVLLKNFSKGSKIKSHYNFLWARMKNYDVIRGNIHMMNPLHSISQVYSMLVQEDNKKEVKAASHFLTQLASMNAEL